MNDDRFDQLLDEHLALASARGITPPVIALLAPHSQHAQAAHVERHGHPFRHGNVGFARNSDLMELWTVTDAAGLLRRHAGIGGGAVAALLDDPPQLPDSWMLMLKEGHLAIAAVSDEELAFESVAHYDRLPFQICACCTREVGRRGVMLFPSPNGAKVPVCGDSSDAIAMTTGLMYIVLTHSLPAPSLATNCVNLPVDDDLLASILLKFYSSKPETVAEAVRALRKMGDSMDGWLMETLEGRNELQELAGRVQSGLAGKVP